MKASCLQTSILGVHNPITFPRKFCAVGISNFRFLQEVHCAMQPACGEPPRAHLRGRRPHLGGAARRSGGGALAGGGGSGAPPRGAQPLRGPHRAGATALRRPEGALVLGCRAFGFWGPSLTECAECGLQHFLDQIAQRKIRSLHDYEVLPKQSGRTCVVAHLVEQRSREKLEP